MELFIAGKGPVRLDQSDFVGQGGEGKVFARGRTAYKVYSDPTRMIPVAKIKELAVLTHSDIVRPDEVLLDANNRPVGYTMRRVQDAHALCRLFTRAFRDRKGVTPGQVLALVRAFQETVQHVHDQGVLVVDMNEMNFLVDRDLQRVLFIDVDSYKTPGFPPTAIMDSIRDRHRSDYSGETDWFSFAILTFQMFVGVHPYRGKHPTLLDLDARMMANVSVLNSAVSAPVSSYPLDSIPSAYRDWYEALFEQGLRMPPPTGARCVATVTPHVLQLPATARIKVREILRIQSGRAVPGAGTGVAAPAIPAVRTPPSAAIGGASGSLGQQTPLAILQVIDSVTLLSSDGVIVRGGLKLGWNTLNLRASSSASERVLLVTPRLKRLVLAVRDGGDLRLWDVAQGLELPHAMRADALLFCGDRLYTRQGTGLYEMRWLELPTTLTPMLHHAANVLPNATHLFDGAAFQDLLGACHVSVFPRSGVCHTIRIPELDNCRVLDARFDQNVLIACSECKGQYSTSILRFGDGHRDYDLRTVADSAASEINFVTLDNGICLFMNPSQELEIFSNRVGSASMKVLNEPALQGARLFKDGTQALFARADTLFEMSMVT